MKALSVLASAAMAVILALWIGIEMGQEINAGVPGIGSRFVLAALLLIPSVMLVVAHRLAHIFHRPARVVVQPGYRCRFPGWRYFAQSTMLHSLGG